MKPWRKYTVNEIVDIKRERCLNCPYVKKFGSSGAAENDMYNPIMAKNKAGESVNLKNLYCNYLSMAKHRRGCKPDECEHYKDEVVIKNDGEEEDHFGFLFD